MWAQSLPASWGANAASVIATHIERLAEFLAIPDEGGFTAAAVYHVFVTNEANVVLTKIFKDVTPPESRLPGLVIRLSRCAGTRIKLTDTC